MKSQKQRTPYFIGVAVLVVLAWAALFGKDILVCSNPSTQTNVTAPVDYYYFNDVDDDDDTMNDGKVTKPLVNSFDKNQTGMLLTFSVYDLDKLGVFVFAFIAGIIVAIAVAFGILACYRLRKKYHSTPTDDPVNEDAISESNNNQVAAKSVIYGIQKNDKTDVTSGYSNVLLPKQFKK